MIPDDPGLRRALNERSAEPTPEYRARLLRAFAEGRPASPHNWIATLAVMTVTLLTATSIAALVISRNAGHVSRASGARVTSPTPAERPVPMPNYAVLDAPSRDVVWALVAGDRLYRSIDRGDHWERRPLPPVPDLGSNFSFIDDREGWFLETGSPATQCQAQSAAVWHTTDGGVSWQKLSARGIDGAQCKEVIHFVDRDHGFLGAWDPNHHPTVYFSRDGGRTWNGRVLADPPDFMSQSAGFTLRVGWIKDFGSGQVYLEASGEQGPGSKYPEVPERQYVFESTDGGATWSWLVKLMSPNVVMVEKSRWLWIVPPHDSVETLNAGQQWHSFTTDYEQAAGINPMIVFADGAIGYATVRGTIQRTVDGGTHWKMIKTSWP